MPDDAPPGSEDVTRDSGGQFADSSEDTLGFETVVPEIVGFKIIGLLGSGGMGQVFLAEEESLGRKVAIKIILESLPEQDQVVARFRREARSMAAIDHPNIVHLYSFGEVGGRPYFVMQYVEGQSLAERISKSGNVSVADSVRVVHQVNDALEAAWRQKIVHRDLKPANVLLDLQSNAHVADFGLARPVVADQGATVTQTGQLLGTPTYLAPEQARGGEIDFRVDIYSLGILFYEMLVGSPPFEATTPLGVVAQHLQDPLPPIRKRQSDIPAEIEKVIRWMASKDPRSRPGSHEELRQRLSRTIREDFSHRVSTGVYERRANHEVHTDRPSKTDFTPPAPLSREGLKETERRQATVFKAAIPSFPGLADAVEPETAAVVASEILNILTLGIERSGGTLIEVTPSKISAIFGFPVAFENSPREAVNAAIGIRNSLRVFRQEHDLPMDVHIRIGVSTGPVIASGTSQDGDVRYTIMGDAVEAAATLRDHAADEQILVSRLTRRNTTGDFRYGPEHTISSKKRHQSLRAIELQSDRQKVHRTPASSDRLLSSALVGRRHEFDRLELHILELLNGQGSIVNVVGPAGIGKSRLTAELRSLNSTKKLIFLEGRSVATGESLGFHPIIDLLKNWAQISEQDSNTDAVRKLHSAVTRVDPEGRDEIFPFVATLMGLRLTGSHAELVQGIEGENLRQLIVKSVRNLIVTASTVQPLVFILEDLHWADQTSIEFLESLYRVVIDHNILFINVFRPGFADTSERIADYLRDVFANVFEEIQVGPLESRDCELLVANMFGTEQLPGWLTRKIIDKADGNPFFVEEVGRSFIEEGAVVLDHGRVRVSDAIETVHVPETIQDVLMARVDRLDDETRSLIRVAAVIGRRFFDRVLRAVAGNIDQLGERLEFLQQLKMIRQLDTRDEIQYSFKHALTQEVVYDSILDAHRKRLHLKIAEAIEDLFSERLYEFYGTLAFHYCAAEEIEQAEDFLIKAGSEALKSAASREALNSYKHALDLYSERLGSEADAKKIAHLEKSIAVALYNHGQYAEAVKSARKVLPHFNIRSPSGDVDLMIRSLAGFASFIFTVHLPGLKFKRTPTSTDSEGIRLYYQCLAATVHHNPKRFLLESFILAKRLSRFDLNKVENGIAMFASSGNLLAWTGASFYLSKKVLSLLDERFDVPDIKTEISLAAARITHAFLAGDWDPPPYDEDLVQRALSVGEVFLTSNYVIFHGRLALERGQIELSQRIAEQLNEIGKQYDHHYPPALHVYLHSKILLKTRELDTTITECTEGERIAADATLDVMVLSLGSFKARVQAFTGDLEEADRTLRQVEEASKRRRLPRSYRGDILLSRCTIEVLRLKKAWQERDTKRISRIKKQTSLSCKKLLRNSKMVASHRVEAARLTGMYYLFSGNLRKAAHHWDVGLRTGSQLGADLDLARLYLEIGRWCVDPQIDIDQLNGTSGTSYIERARALFERMDINWDLAELADI
jgi:serine/threonine protein kinase/tetratricopeptide (TPR) repeat protein